MQHIAKERERYTYIYIENSTWIYKPAWWVRALDPQGNYRETSRISQHMFNIFSGLDHACWDRWCFGFVPNPFKKSNPSCFHGFTLKVTRSLAVIIRQNAMHLVPAKLHSPLFSNLWAVGLPCAFWSSGGLANWPLVPGPVGKITSKCIIICKRLDALYIAMLLGFLGQNHPESIFSF